MVSDTISGGVTVTVAEAEADIRLDRWFRRHYPALGHARLEKLLRTGQVRVDGARCKASTRLTPGQAIRVPPLGEPGPLRPLTRPLARPLARAIAVSETQARRLRATVLYRDGSVIAIDKPAGLAVQGGSKTVRHLDGMLDALRFDAPERPRLVHRLDKDTSGVLLLARDARAASWLAEAFRGGRAVKTYWALVAGVPKPSRGRIDLALGKAAGPHGESMSPESEHRKRAVTDYAVIDAAGETVAWLALHPRTGRTHQLRAHCAALGTPVLGDHKYGGGDSRPPGPGIARRLHLHARAIAVPLPGGGTLEVAAPLPDELRRSWLFFGFDPESPPSRPV